VLSLQGQALPEPAARALFQQLMVAVDYCHRLGIANRDIKVREDASCVECSSVLADLSQHVLCVKFKSVRAHTFQQYGHAARTQSLCQLAVALFPHSGGRVGLRHLQLWDMLCTAAWQLVSAAVRGRSGWQKVAATACLNVVSVTWRPFPPVQLDNLLLHNGAQLKMADFGFSKDTLGQSTCKSSCGTPEVQFPLGICLFDFVSCSPHTCIMS
jgi:serine/threonine protein kinase